MKRDRFITSFILKMSLSLNLNSVFDALLLFVGSGFFENSLVYLSHGCLEIQYCGFADVIFFQVNHFLICYGNIFLSLLLISSDKIHKSIFFSHVPKVYECSAGLAVFS